MWLPKIGVLHANTARSRLSLGCPIVFQRLPPECNLDNATLSRLRAKSDSQTIAEHSHLRLENLIRRSAFTTYRIV